MTKINYRFDPSDSLVPQPGRPIRSEVVQENFQVLANAGSLYAFDTVADVVTVTRLGSTVTVTTERDHEFLVADTIIIAGADGATTDYNGEFAVDGVLSATIFTYDIGGPTPPSPATGTITARRKNRVGVTAGNYQTDGTTNQNFVGGFSPELDTSQDGGANAPTFSTDQLAAVLEITGGGGMSWNVGAWALFPTPPMPPAFTALRVPIVTVVVTADGTEITSTDMTDVRPLLNLGGGGGGGGITWSTPVDDDIIPDSDNTYDLGSGGAKFKDGFFAGKLTVDGGIDPIFLQLNPVAAGSVPDNSFFIDTDDGDKLKFKDAVSTVFSINDSTTLSEYDFTSTNVGATEEQDILTATIGNEVEKGYIGKVVLGDDLTLGAGEVQVDIYNDTGRTELRFSRVFDLSQDLVDVIPVYFESDNDSGNNGVMYVDVTNNTGSSSDFSVNITVTSILPAAIPLSASGGVAGPVDAGDGITYNVPSTRFDLDLSTNSGLSLIGDSGDRTLEVTAGAGIAVTTSVAVDSSVIRDTGDQDIAGKKRFTDSTFGLTPDGSAGPPTGASIAGDFHLDVNFNLFQCISSGTPGTWQFYGNSFEQGIDLGIAAGADNATYTDVVASGSTLTVILSTGISINADANRRGTFTKFNVWGAAATMDTDPDTITTGNLDQGFRVQCFPNETRLGREQLWSISGQIRKTDITGAVTTLQNTFPVDTVNTSAADDLARTRALGTSAEEYVRITARRTGTPEYDGDENALNVYAADDPFMLVTEFVELPWINNSSIMANRDKIYLEFKNDGATDIIFGFQFDLESRGG